MGSPDGRPVPPRAPASPPCPAGRSLSSRVLAACPPGDRVRLAADPVAAACVVRVGPFVSLAASLVLAASSPGCPLSGAASAACLAGACVRLVGGRGASALAGRADVDVAAGQGA
jgi:hypothetical protein